MAEIFKIWLNFLNDEGDTNKRKLSHCILTKGPELTKILKILQIKTHGIPCQRGIDKYKRCHVNTGHQYVLFSKPTYYYFPSWNLFSPN